jgi:2-polyprenyl-6-methoxyphenol hydroxylase-like FAD-dependent oxidoreductase
MNIAIVGCGVAGQTAAIALSRAGHAVTVFERFAAARPLGAGLLLQPSGLAALERLGLADAALQVGAKVHRLHGKNARGRTVLDLNYADYRPDAFGLGIHRASLFDLLHTALLATSTKLRLGFEVARIENFDAPSLVASDGRKDGPFDLVLIAAGAHDTLRRQVSPKGRDHLYTWAGLWTTCADPDNRFADALRQTYDAARIMIGVLPVGRTPAAPGPHVVFFWSLKHADYTAEKELGVTGLRKHVEAYWPEAAALLDQVPSFDALALATYRNARPRACHRGRVLLIGDTSHATSPQLGQGANLAIIDAVTLAHAIARASSVDAAIQTYRRLRRSHTDYYQWMSAVLTPAYQSDSRFLAWFRDVFFLPMSRLPVGRTFMQRTLTGYARMGFTPWRLPE